MEGIESGVGGVWQTRQSVAGTIERSDATTMKRLRKADDDGGLSPRKTYGSEEFVDGLTWGSPGSFTQEVGGLVGTLKVQGQIEIVAYEAAQFFGSDVVTGASDPFTHTISSGTAVPALNTFYQRTGVNTIVRQSFYDAKVSKLQLDAGQDENSRVLHTTIDVMALRAGAWFTTDPVAADSAVDPLLWTEAVTRYNGTAFPELTGDKIEADAKLGVHRGQNSAPVCFTYSKGELMRTADGIVTDSLLAEIKNVLYNTTTPTNGLAIADTVIQVPIVATYTRSARRTLTITTPLVEIRPDDWAFGPRAQGGPIPVAFGGRCKAGGSPAITIVALTGDSAAYV